MKEEWKGRERGRKWTVEDENAEVGGGRFGDGPEERAQQSGRARIEYPPRALHMRDAPTERRGLS